ncbi:MAG TPA: acyltransferase domain-containing protein, partial [Candidatus Deferrimicrobium sp.]|nr:acyltransferase domain-containing protein [Candidatus Deferrimicrobium sp.]
IKEILYPGNPGKQSESTILHEKIKDFQIAQWVIFIFEYALAQLLLKWGITPMAMIGYSFGEYVAACLAGVFSLEDALRLAVSRGKLMDGLPGGAMLSIPLSKKELIPLLNDSLAIAIDNGPSCIVAGPGDAVETLQAQLKAQRWMCMPMDSSYAVHSQMMGPVLTAFREIAGKIKMNEPQIPYISNLTGTWITPGDVANPSYWSNHLSQTVQFAEGIKELLKKKNAIFIEVGPGRDLNALVGRYFENLAGYHSVNLIRPAEQNISDIYYLLNKIGHLWLYGLKLNWEEFYSQHPSRVSLPAYPFERQYYWLETDLKSELSREVPGIADWAYLPLWKRSILRENKQESKTAHWLIFMGDSPLIAGLIKKLQINRHIIIVKKGDRFEKLSSTGNPLTYIMNPREFSHYPLLFEHLHKDGTLPHHIIHSWYLTAETAEIPLNKESFDNDQYDGFYSLLYMAKALEKHVNDNTRITFLTNHVYDVTGGEIINPGKAPALGLLKV